MADIELVILETVPNIIFVPLFNNTAIPIQTKNKKKTEKPFLSRNLFSTATGRTSWS